MTSTDEARLMAQAAHGDRGAFDAIVRHHQSRLQRFATRMLGGDAGRGADVSVAALLRLWEVRADYREHGRLESWLLRTAYRLCIDELRKETAVCLDDDLPASVDEERRALRDAVRCAVMELPEAHRAVLVLCTYEELSYEEVAQVLEISPGTVASRRNSALKLLRRRLAAWDTP